jgi:ABC-type multidrug transport system ATPase subunit
MNNTTITISGAGKRFNREWIFRNLHYQFISGNSYGIIGFNGSGKSTLLQCIAGSMLLSEGNISYQNNTIDTKIESENVFKLISICAPYLEIVEEMTSIEFLQFHQQFNPLIGNISIQEIINIIGLEKASNKQIRNFSSGMKQRLKLAQAIFSDAPILLLDEPCTNLDKEGYKLYHQLINDYCNNKLLIICSNEEAEIEFCSERLNIVDYK